MPFNSDLYKHGNLIQGTGTQFTIQCRKKCLHECDVSDIYKDFRRQERLKCYLGLERYSGYADILFCYRRQITRYGMSLEGVKISFHKKSKDIQQYIFTKYKSFCRNDSKRICNTENFNPHKNA